MAALGSDEARRDMHHSEVERSLRGLLQALERAYDFVTPLNSTIATVRARRETARAGSLRDVLGWSLPFLPGALDDEIEGLLAAAGALRECELGFKATVRVSRVQGRLFLHSAYPTDDQDAVFLGPDSYRFAEFLRVELGGRPIGSLCDVGAGAGVGGVIAARLTAAERVLLCDVNAKALHLAKVNAAHASCRADLVETPGLTGVEGGLDLIVANPPFVADSGRAYSDGGGSYGAVLSLQWATEAMGKLNVGGRLLLYTGSAIVDGRDLFRAALQAEAASRGCGLTYRELDPDIFGGLLWRSAYQEVERIAAVGAVVTRRN